MADSVRQSFVFTTVGSWIAARRLGVANVDLEPEESSSGSQEGWTVHVGEGHLDLA